LGGAVGVLSLGAMHANAATATAAATASAASSDTVNELVVVAEHRTTALQKIPVAVSVFTGQQRDLAGITSIHDVTSFAPGFAYDPATVHAYIRGVGRQSVNITDDQRVSTYEDEFYVYSPYNLDHSSLFLAQAQIERGPQNVGGRQAEGGSIDQISVRPTDHPYAEIRGEIANFQTYNIEAAASTEVMPGLDLRLSGFDHNQSQGYYNNLVPGLPSEGGVIHEWYVEGQADWKPNDKFEWWSRAFAEAWNNRGDAGARTGFGSGSWDETSLTDANEYVGGGLFVNPNFGYAAPAAAGGNAGANAGLLAAQKLGDTDPTPTSVTLFNPAVRDNPAALDPHQFAAPIPRTVTIRNFDDYNTVLTYHADGFDIKYTGGIQNYDYDLNYAASDTNVASFTLPGSVGNPAVASFNNIMANVGGSGPFTGCATAGNPLCAGVVLPAAQALPSPSALVINPLINANYEEDDTWTAHDISFQSNTDAPFQWQVGAFYYWQYYNQPYLVTDPNQPQLTHPDTVLGAPAAIMDKAFIVPVVNPTGFVGFTAPTLAAANPNNEITLADYRFDVTSAAGYGQFSYKFNDQFKFTGNIRYTADSKQGTEDYRTIQFAATEIDGFSSFFGAATPALDVTPALVCPTGNNTTSGNALNPAGSCVSGTNAKGVTSAATLQSDGSWKRGLGDTSSAVTGGADLDWTPTPDIFAYARYSRGYESMSFTAGTIAANPEVSPEFINAYEIGYKQSIGHQLSFDTAVFYYDYEGLQLPISVSVGGVTLGAFINVPKAVSEGVELEGFWTPIRNFVVSASYSYDYSAITTGCSGTLTAGALTPAANALCIIDTNDPAAIQPGANPFPGQTGASKNQGVNGNPLPDAPQNKFAIAAAYTWNFDPGSFTFDVNYTYRSGMDGTVFNRFYDNAPSAQNVDLRGTWKGDHDRYEIIGFVKNVTDSLQYNVGAGGGGLAGSATAVTSAATGLNETNIYDLAPPRTYGIELRYKFF
ncbi:MAG TPA: TonB-dependent receptor, partial [Caulobacteraceae bacterium]